MMYQLTWQSSGVGGWSPIKQLIGDINSVHRTYNALIELSRHTQNPLNAEVRALRPHPATDESCLVYKWGGGFSQGAEDYDEDPLSGYRNRG